jgi:hypothetical protein
MRCGYRDEQLVLVSDVNTVQTPKGIVASIVRLQPANEFYRICGRTIDSPDSAAVKVGEIRTYWERCIVTGNPAIGADQLTSEKVKCGPQIVNTIADDGTPFVRNRNEQEKLVSFVTSLFILLNFDGVWPSVLKSADGGIQVRQVFFGPVNLYANPTKISHDRRPDELFLLFLTLHYSAEQLDTLRRDQRFDMGGPVVVLCLLQGWRVII